MRNLIYLTILICFMQGCTNVSEENSRSGEKNETNIASSLLLKDYRPQSIFNTPKTNVNKATYPVIDMHSHANADSPEALDEWVRVMDEVGIQKTIVLSAATGAQFDSIYAVYSRYPNRFDVWCSFDYSGYDQPGYGPAAVAELERCAKVGAKGVGELGDKGQGLFYNRNAQAWGMHFDDERLDPLFEKCAELNLPINIHVAEPKWMYEPMDNTNDGFMNALNWRRDKENDLLNHEELLQTLENAVKRHPNTIFIAAHYANCSYDLSILGTMFDRYPNLYADISARFFYIATIPRYAKMFCEKYQDRLLYGTDWGRSKKMYQLTFRIMESEDEHFYGHEYEFHGYHWPINGVGLEANTLKKVYNKNAFKLLSM